MKVIINLSAGNKRINRNILECKSVQHEVATSTVCVLIETYWNVNTWARKKVRKTNLSINRNILECKFGKKMTVVTGAVGINRNILECKSKFYS